MTTRPLATSLALLLAAVPALAQDRNRPGPWDGDLWLLESKDGLRFEKQRLLVEAAGVPTLIADRTGRLVALFQWFPEDRREAWDRVAVSISTDQGATWTDPEPIVVEGYPDDLMRPFDPTIVELEDGRYRLYFTTNSKGKGRSCPRIASAISADARRWTWEPGDRLAVGGEFVIDCAAARLGDEWHLFSPVQEREGSAYHAVSMDGLEFERLEDLELDAAGNWLGCAVPVGGALRFYGTGRDGWAAESRDGRTWRANGGARWERAVDPRGARLPAARWIMVATILEPPARKGR